MIPVILTIRCALGSAFALQILSFSSFIYPRLFWKLLNISTTCFYFYNMNVILSSLFLLLLPIKLWFRIWHLASNCSLWESFYSHFKEDHLKNVFSSTSINICLYSEWRGQQTLIYTKRAQAQCFYAGFWFYRSQPLFLFVFPS